MKEDRVFFQRKAWHEIMQQNSKDLQKFYILFINMNDIKIPRSKAIQYVYQVNI